MSDNTEYFPQQLFIENPNTHIDTIIKGKGNVIAYSARNVFVNGDSNYLGEDTKDINILNSSGCVISSGVVGCVIISSSGVVVTNSGQLYIKNKLISEDVIGGFSSSAYKKIYTDYTVTLDDGTIDCISGVSIVTLPSANGHIQKFNIKNNQETDVQIDGGGSTIDIDDTIVTISKRENLTVQGNGTENYLIL